MFEIELRRLGLHEHWYEDRNEFGQKVADLGEKVDYWKQLLAGLDILLKTFGTPERIRVKSMKDVEESLHARMCEVAEEQCGSGVCAAALGVGCCCRRRVWLLKYKINKILYYNGRTVKFTMSLRTLHPSQ